MPGLSRLTDRGLAKSSDHPVLSISCHVAFRTESSHDVDAALRVPVMARRTARAARIPVSAVLPKSRDRRLTTETSRGVMAFAGPRAPGLSVDPPQSCPPREVAPLLSDEHFSADGVLARAWAPMKSPRPRAVGTPPDDDPTP